MGINGSPRKNGNSEILLTKALECLPCDTEQINLREYRILRCLACDVCGKTKDTDESIPCRLQKKDDAVELWEKIVKANGLIIATPVYFGLPTPLLVDFLNRTRYLRHQNFRLINKVFGVIAISARRTGGNETTIFSTWYPLIRNAMIPVGNGDKSCQFGVVGWAGARGEILEDEWAITQARDLAERVYDLCRVIEAGIAALNWKNPLRFDYTSGTMREWELGYEEKCKERCAQNIKGGRGHGE